ncbi:hypothetical protein SSP531S_43920 [Streptomyces spongiicola]|uniref:Uncharacterized protein n=1 Tax=Streptomyces spongiicola TaxID=1690221 RepID=A0A388T1V7_9ACTN|nr:hypothetical protein SSP531S_43920 [Streptomyces spongiicola]
MSTGPSPTRSARSTCRPPSPRSVTTIRFALRPEHPAATLAPGDGAGLRELLARHGGRDSLGRLALRRDKGARAVGRCPGSRGPVGPGIPGSRTGRPDSSAGGRRPVGTGQRQGRDATGPRLVV